MKLFPILFLLLRAFLASAQTSPGQANLLPAFWKSRLADVDAAIKEGKRREARVLARSAGRRKPFLVTYGDRQDLRVECCLGVKTEPYAKLTHEQILDMQLLMYEELFKFALEHPVDWSKP